MSPCYDPRDKMEKDALREHHRRIEELMERMLNAHPQWQDEYDDECARFERQRRAIWRGEDA